MNKVSPITALNLTSPEATADFARALGSQLRVGDVLLLTGSIGAGKTHFARALIQSLLTEPEDVPSPTFTLVQEYETDRGPLWHSDLYRLNSPDEIEELGLLEAFSNAICIVEWPDRLGDLAPVSSLMLQFSDGPSDNSRQLDMQWTDSGWNKRIDAALTMTSGPVHGDEVADFLATSNWDDAEATQLAGDASSRRYTRLDRRGETAILMQDPDGDTSLFATLARHLTQQGLSAPHVLAEARGLLLLEDLGDGLVAKLAIDAEAEKQLYLQAVDTLVALHQKAAPSRLPRATPELLTQSIDLAFTHYVQKYELLEEAQKAFGPILDQHASPQDVMVLRDFHAENILHLPDRTGAARTGLLDFQDAVCGHTAYDLVSLCRDVRRDLFPDTENACIEAYLAATDSDPEAYRAAYAVLGVQRNLRILGVFARLAITHGKTRYLDFLPRTWDHIQAQMTHPALAPMRPIISQLPAPVGDHLKDLRAQCPTG